MDLRYLLRLLNDQYIIDKLSNTVVIRRLAQLTHYTYLRMASWGNKALKQRVDAEKTKEQLYQKGQTRLGSFSNTFFENIQKEIERSQGGKKK